MLTFLRRAAGSDIRGDTISRFAREALNEEIIGLKLYTEGDHALEEDEDD